MYYRTDEEVEAADALSHAARFADELATDCRMWRWVILALHNAAQGFMVLSLRHGNGLLALTPESAAEWLDAYESGAQQYPDEKLDSYLGLYKKVKSAVHGTVGGNQQFEPSGSQGRSIRKLNRIRNEFIHFTPKSWSLELAGLPRICLDVLVLVEFLGWATTNILWHDQAQLKAARAAHARLTQVLHSLEITYAKVHAS